MLDSLVRTVGLYPYADVHNYDTAELLAYEFHRPIGMDDETVCPPCSGGSVSASPGWRERDTQCADELWQEPNYRRDHCQATISQCSCDCANAAPIDETRRRLSAFADFKVITHNDQSLAKKNIFVLTQERLIGFENFPKIEFFVIDEFYKLGLESDEGRAISLNVDGVQNGGAGSVAAVEIGGAHWCILGVEEDGASAPIFSQFAGRPRSAIRHGVWERGSSAGADGRVEQAGRLPRSTVWTGRR